MLLWLNIRVHISEYLSVWLSAPGTASDLAQTVSQRCSGASGLQLPWPVCQRIRCALSAWYEVNICIQPPHTVLYITVALSCLTRLFKPLHSYHHPLQSIRLCYIPPLSCYQVIILLCFVPSAKERQKHIILWNQATGFEMKETWKLEHSPLMLLSLFSSLPSPVMRSCRSTCYSWCRCCVMSLIMTAPSPTSCWSVRRATAR